MPHIKPYGISVYNTEVKTQGKPFDLKMLYVMMHEWMLENEYAPDDKDPNFPETFYYDSVSQTKGRELWVWWRNKKAPQKNPFYRRSLNVNLHGLGMMDIETVINGTKRKLAKGEFWISIKAILELDYQGKWRKHWLLKYFLDLFWKRIFWKSIESHKHELLKDAHALHQQLKQFFEIRMHVPVQKSFWPELGTKQ